MHIDHASTTPTDMVHVYRDPTISIPLNNNPNFRTELKMDAWTGLPEKFVTE